jgi:6-phosphogluconolactonase
MFRPGIRMGTLGGRFFCAALMVAPFAACGGDDEDKLGDGGDDDGGNGDGGGAKVLGTLYTMTNEATGNEIVVYDRIDDGSLDERGRVDASGNGSGPGDPNPFDPLASQDAVLLSQDGALLFAVNAGSDTIATFTVSDDGDLALVGTTSSGDFPVGLAQSPDGAYLYVLNGFGAGSISGFTAGSDGTLDAIAGSAQPLSGADPTAPAQIAFSPDGAWLIVTEKATSMIDTYAVDSGGVAGAPNTNAAAAITPFGAMFTSDGTLVVSNANAADPMAPVVDGGSASSYTINGVGGLEVVTAMAPSYGTAACWIEFSGDDETVAYATNTASGSISGFDIAGDGTLTPLDTTVLATLSVTGATPLDMARANGFLYTISGNMDAMATGSISVHTIGSDGSLTSVNDAAASTGLPAWVTGLAAR